MESGACAVRAGLLQPQTGRPVTKQALHRAGSDNDDSTGHWHKEYSQRDNNTDAPEYSEYYAWASHWASLSCVFLLMFVRLNMFVLGVGGDCVIFPCSENISQSWGIQGGL